ncbi:hypothetical protein GE21DRAFT_1100472 [Neurospora crassa]|nr:hypothetical protein GE21DRAFT_1100472 [Neurospora crassa]
MIGILVSRRVSVYVLYRLVFDEAGLLTYNHSSTGRNGGNERKWEHSIDLFFSCVCVCVFFFFFFSVCGPCGKQLPILRSLAKLKKMKPT